MAWEQRGSRQYYYSSSRIGGRVKKIYLGRGTAAANVARSLEKRRADRESDRLKIAELA